MNDLCPACGQPVEVVDFRLDQGHVVVRCRSCGQQRRLALSEASGAEATPAVASAAVEGLPAPASRPTPPPAAGPRAIEADFEVPAAFCPKCVTPRSPAATSCPACGLVFSNAVRDSALQPSSTLADAWRALAAHWNDAAEHTRFLQLADASGELTAACHLYRIRLARAPQDALARNSLEAAVKLASAPVMVAALRTAQTPGANGRAKAVAVAAVMLLAPTLVFALLRLLGRH